jgi:hypothetical protein
LNILCRDAGSSSSEPCHCCAFGEETSLGEGVTSTVMPPVKSGFVRDVTFTLIKCINGYSPMYRSKISTLASAGIVWQPGKTTCAGSEVMRPAMSTATRPLLSTQIGRRPSRALIAEVFVDVSGREGGTFDVPVAPALTGVPSCLFVEGVLSAFAGAGPSVFAGLFCFRALKQATRSALCSMARQRSTSSFVAA